VIHEVTDLNVMVRRGRFSASVRRLDKAEIIANADDTLVLFREDAQVISGEKFERDDVIHLSAPEVITFVSIPQTAWLIEVQSI
jgi:uncharacterized protein